MNNFKSNKGGIKTTYSGTYSAPPIIMDCHDSYIAAQMRSQILELHNEFLLRFSYLETSLRILSKEIKKLNKPKRKKK